MINFAIKKLTYEKQDPLTTLPAADGCLQER